MSSYYFVGPNTSGNVPGGQTINGNQTVNGTATAQNFVVSPNTGSVSWAGSTKLFGNNTNGALAVQTSAGAAGLLILGSSAAGGASGVGIARSGGDVVVVNGDGTATANISAAIFKTNVGAPAGGVALISNGNSGASIYSGTGAPSITAQSGSIYMRTDGASQSRIYINTGTGASATWTPMTTVAPAP